MEVLCQVLIRVQTPVSLPFGFGRLVSKLIFTSVSHIRIDELISPKEQYLAFSLLLLFFIVLLNEIERAYFWSNERWTIHWVFLLSKSAGASPWTTVMKERRRRTSSVKVESWIQLFNPMRHTSPMYTERPSPSCEIHLPCTLKKLKSWNSWIQLSTDTLLAHSWKIPGYATAYVSCF